MLDQLKKLRDTTGVGMMECKKALEEANNDFDKAIEILRKSGQMKAVQRGERETKEGLVHAYIHANNKVGALVEVQSETDFVARGDDFKQLTHDIAMQVVGAGPKYVNIEDIPVEELEKEKEIYREQLQKENKPVEVIEQIIAGKLQKFYEEVCLMEQSFIKDDKIKIKDLVVQYIQKLGENIVVKRFERYQI